MSSFFNTYGRNLGEDRKIKVKKMKESFKSQMGQKLDKI
jgi:hypothetical protein